MKKIILILIFFVICVIGNGCASLLRGRTQEVEIRGNEPSAHMEVYNSYTRQIHYSGPVKSICLPRGNGEGYPARYSIKINKEGYSSFSTGIWGRNDGLEGINILFWAVFSPIARAADRKMGGAFVLPDSVQYSIYKIERDNK